MIIPNNKLRYIIHSDFYGDREIFPSGESSVRLSMELHDDFDDPLHDYIFTLTGKLVLFSDDYDWIKTIEDDIDHRGDDLAIEVLFSGSGAPVDLVPGTRLILNDGIFDLDKCTVEIPIVTPDVYEAFNKKKDDELNFFDLLSSGTFYDINVLDYTPTFEYHTSRKSAGFVGGDLGSATLSNPTFPQNFVNYPNKRCQYKGYGCDDETQEDFFPSTSPTLFDSQNLVDHTIDALTGADFLNVGDKPFHDLYATPDLAIADGWRLYSFSYVILSQISMDFIIWDGHWRWCRETIDVVIGTPMTPEWVFVGVVAGMDRWARKPLLVPRTNEVLTGNDETNNFFRINFDNTTYIVGATTGATTNVFGFESLVNGKALNDVIEWAISRCDPSLTVVSDFFQINPVTVSTDNYVTGLPSFTDQIIMFQKTDVKRPFASNHATIGTFAPSKLIYWLFKMFRVKYRIDGSTFRIEHVTSDYFIRTATRDLTISPLNRMLAGTRRYSYDKEQRLPAKETFMFMEARPQGDTFPLNDFNGVPILYDGANVDRTADNGTFAHLVDRVTTDVHFIMNHSGGIGYLIDATTKNPYPVQDAANDTTIDDDGFCLVASTLVITGPTSERFMRITDPIIGTDRDMNNVLGWASLHDAFFRSQANTKHGTLNNVATVFDSTKYIKKSISLPFNLCDVGDFDPFELIVSALGTGIVKTAEYDFQEEKLTVVLGYQE